MDPSWLQWPCLQIGDQLGHEIEEELKIDVLRPAAEDMAQ